MLVHSYQRTLLQILVWGDVVHIETVYNTVIVLDLNMSMYYNA
jgi:hypothetical protein